MVSVATSYLTTLSELMNRAANSFDEAKYVNI